MDHLKIKKEQFRIPKQHSQTLLKQESGCHDNYAIKVTICSQQQGQ